MKKMLLAIAALLVAAIISPLAQARGECSVTVMQTGQMLLSGVCKAGDLLRVRSQVKKYVREAAEKFCDPFPEMPLDWFPLREALSKTYGVECPFRPQPKPMDVTYLVLAPGRQLLLC